MLRQRPAFRNQGRCGQRAVVCDRLILGQSKEVKPRPLFVCVRARNIDVPVNPMDIGISEGGRDQSEIDMSEENGSGSGIPKGWRLQRLGPSSANLPTIKNKTIQIAAQFG